MIGINNEKQNVKLPDGLEMYFNEEVVRNFAAREQNEKHYKVAKIIEALGLNVLNKRDNIQIAELGGGAHPDRYDELFTRLLEGKNNVVDWVDVSSLMIKEAKKYLTKCTDQRKDIIQFKCVDIFDYLKSVDDNKIDLAIMKYVFEYIQDIDNLFKLLNQKLKSKGKVIITKGVVGPKLFSHSSNVHYSYNDKLIPFGESRDLEDGDKIGMHFFAETDKPEAGYLKGAVTSKFFYSQETVEKLAKKHNFKEVFIGEWLEYLQGENEVSGELKNVLQGVIVLGK